MDNKELENIIILEEDDKKKQPEKDIDTSKINKKKKNILFIIILAVTLLIVVVVLIILLIKKSNTKDNLNINQITQKIISKEKLSYYAPVKLETLIKKANILYANGDKKEALKLFTEIASSNESISNYNIGVAKMKEKKYKEAIKYFKIAMQNGQNRCISAINSAVCALKIGNKKLFKYYIDLAQVYLPFEIKTPLYSYCVALINYYHRYYFETIIPLDHRSSKYYKEDQDYLQAKIFSFFHDNLKAINFLEKNDDLKNEITLGLLYDSIGDYSIALKHFIRSFKAGIAPVRSKKAMALTYIKMGLFKNSVNAFKDCLDINKSKCLKLYPVSISLNPSLYDVKLAQKDFEKNIFLNKKNEYGLLFYYAPYKIFNANQTIEFIRKGSIGLSIGETKSALMLLSQSSNISKINKKISIGVEKALNHKILDANKIFNSLKNKTSNHSVLYYDLGLTYAQIGDYTLAYKNFIKSYHLNSSNHLAGIFAIFTKELIHKNNQKLVEEVVSDLTSNHKIKNKKFYFALIDFAKNNLISSSAFVANDNSDKSLNLIFDAIIAKNIKNNNLFLMKSKELYLKIPKDMMANIIYIYAQNQNRSVVEFAKSLQKKFLEKDIDYKSLFYGSNIAKKIYIKSLQISGMLYYARELLEKQLEDGNDDVVGVMQSLGYIDLYTKNYEEAYAVYNELIDTYKLKNTRTLFLASVASIGAGHDANAIALLELAKLTDPNNFESRFALGILYLEIKNYTAAMIQFNKIGNSDFISKYFDFKITKKEL